MRQIIKHEQMRRVLAMMLVVVMVMSMMPVTVSAASPSVLTTDIGEKNFVVGTTTEFTFTTIPQCDGSRTSLRSVCVYHDWWYFPQYGCKLRGSSNNLRHTKVEDYDKSYLADGKTGYSLNHPFGVW